MVGQPVGITFMPSAENQAMGPRQSGIEGVGGTDLASAFKILSLHLPRVLGAQSLSSPRLLNSHGSQGMPNGFNPHAAVIQALLQAMGGSNGGQAPPGSDPSFQTDGLRNFFRNENPRLDPYGSSGGSAPPPSVTPGGEPRGIYQPPTPSASMDQPSASPSVFDRLGRQNRLV